MGLNLAHELLLLDLDEAKGSEPLGSMLSYGLVGAVLAELALADRIHLDDNRVVIVSSAALGVNSLDLVLSAIAGHEPLDPEAWVQRLEGRVKEPVANELVSAGILSHRHRHLLGFLADERYPEVDPGPERALRARLDAVVVDGAPADPRTAA